MCKTTRPSGVLAFEFSLLELASDFGLWTSGFAGRKLVVLPKCFLDRVDLVDGVDAERWAVLGWAAPA